MSACLNGRRHISALHHCHLFLHFLILWPVFFFFSMSSFVSAKLLLLLLKFSTAPESWVRAVYKFLHSIFTLSCPFPVSEDGLMQMMGLNDVRLSCALLCFVLEPFVQVLITDCDVYFLCFVAQGCTPAPQKWLVCEVTLYKYTQCYYIPICKTFCNQVDPLPMSWSSC